MSLKRYLDEIKSVASETGLYTPLATHIFGAVLGYPAKCRVINKAGAQGISDIRLHSQEDDSEWVIVGAKWDDDDIRSEDKRAKIWRDQVLSRGYISADTFYVVLCAPCTFFVCNLDGQIEEALQIEKGHLLDPRTGAQFPLTDRAFRERLHAISYAASLERRQFEAFRSGKLRSGHIPIAPETLDRLRSVFEDAVGKLKEYCRFRFRDLQGEYRSARAEIAQIDQKLKDIGSGAVKTRQKLLYRKRTLRARHRLALQLFENENDYERFKHDQTYAGTQEEEHFEDIFCTNTAYVALSRLLFVRICEDVGLTTRKISNSGIAVWRNFVENIKNHYQDLLDVAFKDVAHIYVSLFEPTVFDWFGKGDGKLHDILERILFRLNAFNFREINRDVLGSIYQYFRPRVERRRLGEYYTPVEVVDYILTRVGVTSDTNLMEKRILDPACGSFTFGVRAMEALLDAGARLSPENKIELIRRCLRGQDINPFSVFLSHLSLLFALLEIYLQAKRSNPDFEIEPMNVTVQNSLTQGIPEESDLGQASDDRGAEGDKALIGFDYVVGNPPFVRNERLPKQDREVLNEIFPSLAMKNTDLAVYFLHAAAKFMAAEGGKVGMVAPLAIANAQMAAYLRNVLKEHAILELVSLEWCAKQAFPGADIVPMLIFLRKGQRPPDYKVRLVRGITSLAELKRCGDDGSFLSAKSSLVPFDDWAALSPSGDWCLDVAEDDLPVLQKLKALPALGDVARCNFAVKAGNSPEFLRAAELREPGPDEVPFVKGQHIAAFEIATETDEYANLAELDSAADSSIWSELDFYRANAGQSDATGLGRFDYESPRKLATGSPSDVLCCLVPEVYVTLAAAVADPLKVVANNSVIAVVPKKYSAHCLAAIINSRLSRYYSFLTLRAAILLRRRTTWYPRALKALPMPQLTPASAGALHRLAVEASELSARVARSVADAYADWISDIALFTKAGFLAVQAEGVDMIEREDLAASEP
jgi:Eco57I restriction-modification methylase